MSYLNTNKKLMCAGCEACTQVCPKHCLEMKTDDEGFRYPIKDNIKCINCKLCERVCPYNKAKFNDASEQTAFGGYHIDNNILQESTSGGAFSAICETFCDTNYAIFGAKTVGLEVYHDYIENIKDLKIFRQSKYVQSHMGDNYKKTKYFLDQGEKVIFSGTPCQIAGLKNYLSKDYDNLLTIEVICEGVPSPLYIEKYAKYISNKKHFNVESVEYRFKDTNKWDFEVMKMMGLSSHENDGTFKSFKIDRWFNPFWNIWLKHLMSRPSCYECQYAKRERVADITLGDLWGVHLYCQDLYNKNKGASLIIANNDKGKEVISNINSKFHIRELNINDAIKYQSPLRKHIDNNDKRDEFIEDLKNMEYSDIIKKWYDKPTIKLLYSKYIWGNRQKVFIWNLKNK